MATEINAGGIAGAIYDGYKEIINCENYGDVYAELHTAGGITAFISTKATISYCKNFGAILGGGGQSGGLVGYIFKYKEVIANISDCECYIDYSRSKGAILVGHLPAKNDLEFNMKNIKAKAYNVSKNVYAFSYVETGKIRISNVEIEIEATQKTYKASFIATSKRSLTMENISIMSNCINQIYNIVNHQHEQVKLTVNSFVAVSTTQLDWFVGSDFSGFFVDYKTGNVGLRSLSGKNFYQGKVTKQWLEQKGFSEKTM